MSELSKYIESKETIYKSLKDVTYLFEEGTNKDYLIIIFSAVNPPKQFSYNYINTLEKLPYNKLFILDNFGEQGAYYLGENLRLDIETSVMSLINMKMAKYNLRNKDIITVGSSKGGFSALYFGMKYSFGNIIVGGAQTKLGNFLYKECKVENIINYVGINDKVYSREYLNNILYKSINKDNVFIPNVYIHIGTGDHHFKNHITPFIKYLKEQGKENIQLDIKEYNSHDGLRKYFPIYLCRTLSNLLGYPLKNINVINRIDVNFNGDFIETNVEVVEESIDCSFAYYLYHNNKIVYKQYYNKCNTFKYKLNEAGEYKVKVFVKNGSNKFMQMSELINICEEEFINV